MCGTQARRRARTSSANPYTNYSIYATSKFIEPIGTIDYVVPISHDVADVYRRSLPRPCPNRCSDSHHCLRKHYLTASRVAGILQMGYGSPEYILKQYVLDLRVKETPAMCEGRSMEPYILRRFSETTGVLCTHSVPLTVHKELPWLAASFDGLTGFLGEPVEIKYMHTRHPRNDEICPIAYWVQMQIQMEVADKENCYYVEYKPASRMGYNEDAEYFNICVVKRDREWFKGVLPRLQWFWNLVKTHRRLLGRLGFALER